MQLETERQTWRPASVEINPNPNWLRLDWLAAPWCPCLGSPCLHPNQWLLPEIGYMTRPLPYFSMKVPRGPLGHGDSPCCAWYPSFVASRRLPPPCPTLSASTTVDPTEFGWSTTDRHANHHHAQITGPNSSHPPYGKGCGFSPKSFLSYLSLRRTRAPSTLITSES